MRRPSAVNEYVLFHPTKAAPVIVPAPLGRIERSRRTPVPSKRSGRRRSNGSPYATPLSIFMLAEANGRV